MTTGYKAYTDGILTTDAFATAVQGVEVQATDSFASSTEYSNLKANFGTFDADGNLLTLASSFANSVVSAYSDDTLATASDISTLQASFTSDLGNYSTTSATNSLIATATADMATVQDITTLDASLRTFVSDSITTSSNAGITTSYLTTVLADYAEATDLTALEASIGTFDANGNITALSSALANQVTSAIATEGYAQVTDVNELKAEIGTFDANGNLTGLSTAFSNEVTDVIASENLASASSVTALESTVNGNTATLTTTASTVSDITGQLASSYGLNLTAGNAIAGMTFLADGQTSLSEIKFVANTFKIDRPGGAISPFIVNADGTISLNGQVTFSSASTGQGIDYADLSAYLTQYNYTTTSDLPDTSAFLDQAALGQYLQDNGYVTGNTAGITEVQLLNILSGQNTTVNTVINGSNITTGIIASGDFQMPINSALSGFSTSGMGINLDNSSIHAEQFYINPDGSANFGGTHSAGSIGSWTVDPSGALKDGSSEIVLDPSGNYTEAGTEKLILSSENLPAISPSAAVSANFTFQPSTLPNGLNSSTPNYSSYRKTTATGYQAITSGSKRYKYSYPDLIGSLPGANVQNNISYDAYTGGTFEYVIPYGQGPDYDAFTATMGFQKGFGADYGWGSIALDSTNTGDPLDPFRGEAPDDTGGLNYNAIPNVSGVAGLDYELKVTFRFSFVPDDLSNGLVKILHTEEKVLRSGTITKNLRDAADGLLEPNSDIEYFGFELGVPGNWASGQIAGSFTPTGADADVGTSSNPGKIAVVAAYHYEITNMYIWAASVPNTRSGEYLLNSTSQPWAYTFFTGRQYLSSGEDTYNSFSNVLFTGSGSKTNIGLNGMQVRGAKGFVAFGDVVPGSDNAVAQIWGNANVFGTITSNASQSFSYKNLKDNIIPISNALDTVSKLAPVSFNWKPDMRGVDLETKYGFIAQDVQGVIPSIVKDGKHLTLEHNNIISINTAAIKELVNEINELKEEIKTLKENNG